MKVGQYWLRKQSFYKMDVYIYIDDKYVKLQPSEHVTKLLFWDLLCIHIMDIGRSSVTTDIHSIVSVKQRSSGTFFFTQSFFQKPVYEPYTMSKDNKICTPKDLWYNTVAELHMTTIEVK